MELKDATLADGTPRNMVNNDHKVLLEWSVTIFNMKFALSYHCRACKCKHIEVATHLIERIDDPDGALLQSVKGTLNVLHLMAKPNNINVEILNALYKKYPNLVQCINVRTPAQVDNSIHDRTPMSIACQFSNDEFFKWAHEWFNNFNNTLTIIDLYNTGLAGVLPLKVFKFTNLKTLNVSKNKLIGISEVNDHEAFTCGELEKAFFSDNNFTVIPKILFLLPKLKELNFARNAVKELNLDGIEVQKVSVRTLNLSGNRIETVPTQLFCLPHLDELNLDDNQIAELPVEIWFAPRLNQLSISNNLLTELPVPTCEGDNVDRNLYSLDSNATSNFSENSRHSQSFRETMMAPCETIEFEEVDIRVQQGPSSCGLRLSKLNLNNNQLQVIPPNLPCLAPSLQTLLVANNQLNVTPCIKNLPQLLKKLDLSRNRLTKFLAKTFAEDETYPSEICPHKLFYHTEQTCAAHLSHKKLIKLDYLDMSHNMIDDNVNTMYDGISYYENLLNLYLSSNQLKRFPNFILHQPYLWTLDISDNPDIETIPYELSRLDQLLSFKYDGISAPIARNLNELVTTAEKLTYLRSMMGR